jgi:hypothetical protein
VRLPLRDPPGAAINCIYENTGLRDILEQLVPITTNLSRTQVLNGCALGQLLQGINVEESGVRAILLVREN